MNKILKGMDNCNYVLWAGLINRITYSTQLIKTIINQSINDDPNLLNKPVITYVYGFH